MSEFGEPWIQAKHDDSLETARIVACVNALAGVPHPERLPALLEACRASQVGYDEQHQRRILDAYAALYGE